MYSELVKDLRVHRCDAKEDDTQDVCEECAYDVIIADDSTFSGIKDVCTCGLMHRAADAIEELGKAVEREKTYTQFWEDAAETCKVQYEKMEKKMLDWKAVADEHWEAYQHWFHNYMNDVPKWIPVTERLPGKGKDIPTPFRHGWIGCPECGIYKNWTNSPREAVRKWNTRTGKRTEQRPDEGIRPYAEEAGA